MGPLPYPHRASFLASTLVLPAERSQLAPYLARLLSVIVFDHLVRHPIITLEDEARIVDDQGRMLDVMHPQIEDNFDWYYRMARRHEVLWLELSFDPERPQVPVLHARRCDGSFAEWGSSPALSTAQQLGQLLSQWFSERRLPPVAKLPEFTSEDLRLTAERLSQIDAVLHQRGELAGVHASLREPPQRLGVPFLRVLAELARDEARTLDTSILRLDPTHPVARRNHYVTALMSGDAERRAILPIVGDAPMYGKPHLSIWGESFMDRPYENMGVRHQGIAASLMPANGIACHNFSLQLAEVGRREESYRWADRASVAAPDFAAAHLDCVRRLRQVARPGQAFAEAQYRCREILDRATAGRLAPNEWQAPHHAALLIAFAHLDVGRIQEAIELADDAMARLPDDMPTREAFAWAQKRITHWKVDAGLLARAYAWEGHHRGDPGRVLVGLSRGRITDDEDAMMLIDSLCGIGREEQAEVAYWQCAGLDGHGVLGDGKARLASAKALILAGNVDEALDQIQIVQLRRNQSRLEAEINRLLRLAAVRPAAEWDRAIEKRLDRGALRLARMAARDLADFVPGMDTPTVRRALGERTPIELDPTWIGELIAAVPAAQATATQIVQRLSPPKESSLRAADALAQEWWAVLVPPARDRDAHAGGAVLALGLSLAHYFVAAAGPPSPIAGAYRHIATEALHLVRRSRYQLDGGAITALLRTLDGLGSAPEWLLDTWLLRVERALDLEAEHGAYLDGMVAGMPNVKRMLRGDERIGWELRLAHDLASDPSQYEPAAMLFDRCARAVEGGTVLLAWSVAASLGTTLTAGLDVHWLAALGNPTAVAAPWINVAGGLLEAGRPVEGFAASCRGMTAASAKERPAAMQVLAPRWKQAGLAVPLDGDTAFDAGLAAAADNKLQAAVQHLRWATALEPGNGKRAQSLAVALARVGQGHDAIRVLSQHERNDAPRLIGRVLLEAGRDAEAVPVLRYASRRFRTAEDWTTLATAAFRADNDAVCIEAGRKAVGLGAQDPSLLSALATSLYRLGEFVECEQIAKRLIGDSASRDARLIGLHAMARALAGQGRHVDAHPFAKAAAELQPNGEVAADLIETMDRIVAQQTPPVRLSDEDSIERAACDDLETGRFESIVTAITSPSWGIARVALAACEFRRDDESGIPVAPRALDAAIAILGRSEGTTDPQAAQARIRALRIRDNAFIQIDPPPPLGLRYGVDEFERAYAERDRRPHRPSAIMSFSR